MRLSDAPWLLMLACACSGEEEPNRRAPAGGCTDLDYETFGRSFLGRWCTSCHASGLPEGQRYGAPLGLDFDTYAAFVAHSEPALASALARTMPPGATLPAEELADFEEWVGCGAPGGPSSTPAPSTTGSIAPSSPETTEPLCPWEGTWAVTQVACGGQDVTATWAATYEHAEIVFRSSSLADSCSMEVVRTADGCTEHQAWSLEPEGSGWSLWFEEVRRCEPEACRLGPAVCAEGDLGASSDVVVTELAADRVIFSGIAGMPFCPGDIAFELRR